MQPVIAIVLKTMLRTLYEDAKPSISDINVAVAKVLGKIDTGVSGLISDVLLNRNQPTEEHTANDSESDCSYTESLLEGYTSQNFACSYS